MATAAVMTAGVLTAPAGAGHINRGEGHGGGGGRPNTILTVDTDGDVGEFTSLALDANGNPVVSYHDVTNGDLKILRCQQPNCRGPISIETVDSDGLVGWYPSLALDSAGNPVVSYRDEPNGDPRLLRCGNPNCE